MNRIYQIGILSVIALCFASCGEMSIDKKLNYGIVKRGSTIYQGYVIDGKRQGNGKCAIPSGIFMRELGEMTR